MQGPVKYTLTDLEHITVINFIWIVFNLTSQQKNVVRIMRDLYYNHFLKRFI